MLIQRIGSDQTHAFPPSSASSSQARHEALAAKNVQRGLAAKVQELSTTFRKKQRVYMESMSACSYSSPTNATLIIHSSDHISYLTYVIQSYKVMRSKIRTFSSHQAPSRPKARRACRQSMMTWKQLSVSPPFRCHIYSILRLKITPSSSTKASLQR